VTRLVLVDDDEDNLNLFTTVLENYQFTVKPYSDPVAALLEFKPNYYDLLILDYRMPVLNGVELYKKMKEIDGSIKVMIITASHEQLHMDNHEDLQERLEFKIIRKPVTITNLIQGINSLLDIKVQSAMVNSSI